MATPLQYGAYGAEPLDQRRCDGSNCDQAGLTQIVEDRFSYICEQVKNKNVTVWVIGFGIESPDFMRTCAGPGRWFEAEDAETLQESFSNIAKSIGDLRISK